MLVCLFILIKKEFTFRNVSIVFVLFIQGDLFFVYVFSLNILWPMLQGATTQQNEIQVYTVDVGAGINEAELKGTASSPDTRYFYKADTFDSVGALSNILGPKICNGKTLIV